MWLTDEEFEDAVGDALDAVPTEFLDRLDNVVISVEKEPTPAQREHAGGGELLGLFEGVALPDRNESYGAYAASSMPDRITVFSGPVQRVSRSRAEALAQIRVTVVHEVGHYFGIDDARLHELGWG